MKEEETDQAESIPVEEESRQAVLDQVTQNTQQKLVEKEATE